MGGSSGHLAIEGPQGDRFGDVDGGDPLPGPEIGRRPGDAEDAVNRPAGEGEAAHADLELTLSRVVKAAVLADLPRAELGVGVARLTVEAATLPLSGLDDPLPHRPRPLPGAITPEGPVVDLGHLDVEVDPIEERPREPRQVATDRLGAAGAAAQRRSR